MRNGVRVVCWFWGLGSFCIIRQKVEARGRKAENGFGAGRDGRWIGGFGLVGVGDWGCEITDWGFDI